jgi:hypothetical protein
MYQPSYTVTSVTERAAIDSSAAYLASVQPVLGYLKPNSFKFLISRAPNVTYTCQSANLPAVQLGAAMQNTPFVDIPHPGDKVAFGEFNIRFLVNEDMSNYMELYNWIKEIGVPGGGSDWDSALANRRTAFSGNNYNKALSDAALLILDSDNRVRVKLSFQDLFPINVEALDFDITTSGMEYFVGVASFRYKLFTIESVAL